jgi:HK97 family phage prohead protease
MPTALRKAQDSQRRLWTFTPQSLDEEARTVDVVAATETPVLRSHLFGDNYNEVLACTTAAIDAGRLQGMPVIDSHDRSSVLSVIGQVVAHRIAGKQLLTTVKFADSERGRAAFDLVKSGMLTRVSVGYRILEISEKAGRGEIPTVTATRWEPFELSFVSVPADPQAAVRGVSQMPKIIVNDDDVIDDDDDSTQPLRRDAPTQRRFDALIDQAVERGLERETLEAEFDGVRTLDGARAIVFDMLADRANRSRTHPGRSDTRNINDAPRMQEQVVAAFTERLGGTPAGNDNPYRGRSMTEVMRKYMGALGDSEVRSMSDRDLADIMSGARSYKPRYSTQFRVVGEHTTSDFADLLVASGDRVLMSRFNADPSPLKRLSHKRNARDFRPQMHIRPGEAPLLDKVPESGVLTYGTLGSQALSLQIEPYAKGFGLSRKAIINDDLGAFSDFISAFAQSALQTEGNLFFELLSANSFGGKKYSDGKNFFHADHGNLAGAGGLIDVSSLSEARTAMRTQKNVNGTGTAGVTPKVLLVGPALETVAQQVVAQINATKSEDVNPFSGQLQVMVENRYNGNGWWLFADPALRPAFIYGYLDDFDGPFFAKHSATSVTAGARFECGLDFGCDVYEYRAAYFNPGA